MISKLNLPINKSASINFGNKLSGKSDKQKCAQTLSDALESMRRDDSMTYGVEKIRGHLEDMEPECDCKEDVTLEGLNNQIQELKEAVHNQSYNTVQALSALAKYNDMYPLPDPTISLSA